MKFVRRSRAAAFVALAAGFGGAACHDSTGPTAKPAGIRVVSGDGQSAAAGTTLAAAPQFVVYDANGAAISGIKVSISVASGGGKLASVPARTSSRSTSVGEWTFGPHARVNTLVVSVPDVAPLSFSAMGLSGPAAHFIPLAPTSLSGRAGEAVAGGVSARVTDAFDNPVAVAPIELTATAETAPTSATSDSAGTVTIAGWTLGTVAGQSALTLRSGAATLSFIANVLPGDAVNLVPIDSATPSAFAGAPRACSLAVDRQVWKSYRTSSPTRCCTPWDSAQSGICAACFSPAGPRIRRSPTFAGVQARAGCVGDGGAIACANTVPLENDMVQGTADAHWRETVFGAELMTGLVNFGGMPLSAIRQPRRPGLHGQPARRGPVRAARATAAQRVAVSRDAVGAEDPAANPPSLSRQSPVSTRLAFRR